jgi:hypothetical protein
MKLLFFVDLHAISELGKPITPLTWVWYNFGPFAREVYRVLDDLDVTDEIGVSVGRNYFGAAEYHIAPGPNAGYYRMLENREIALIDEVIRELGGLSPQALKERSYHTPPMQYAQAHQMRGAKLRMSIGDPLASPTTE